MKKIKLGKKTYNLEYGNYDQLKAMASCQDRLLESMKSLQSGAQDIQKIEEIVEVGQIFFDAVFGKGSGAKIFKESKRNVHTFLEHMINVINEYNAMKNSVKFSKVNKI